MFLSCGKFCPGMGKTEEEHLFSRSEGRRTVVLSERSEVKTVLLTGERVNSSSKVFPLPGQNFSCDRIHFFGKVASDHTIRSLASN